jgi:predicted SnoaL-like aldol condensation-catalyzing enzyme
MYQHDPGVETGQASLVAYPAGFLPQRPANGVIARGDLLRTWLEFNTDEHKYAQTLWHKLVRFCCYALDVTSTVQVPFIAVSSC